MRLSWWVSSVETVADRLVERVAEGTRDVPCDVRVSFRNFEPVLDGLCGPGVLRHDGSSCGRHTCRYSEGYIFW